MEFVIKSAALVNLVVEEVEVEVLQYVNIFFIAYCIFDRDNAWVILILWRLFLQVKGKHNIKNQLDKKTPINMK